MTRCDLCEEPTDLCECFIECTTCGEKAYTYPQCSSCKTMDLGYLHSLQRVPLVEVERISPGRIAA